MKKIAIVIIAILAVAGIATADQWNKIALQFVIGTTGASSAANSGIIRIPQACQIDSIYLTDLSGVAKDSTDLITVKFYINAVEKASFVSSANALAANTPFAVTPTEYNLAAGDVLQFKATKGASGQATTNLTATVAIFNTSSKR